MSRVIITLETDDIQSISSLELNFTDNQEYESKSSTIYDDEGRPVKMVTTYSYTKEDKE